MGVAGRQVTDAQVKEVRRNLNQGASLLKAAMSGDMDRKTARKYRDLGKLPSEARTEHTWRTRPDPLQAVWPALVELLEREPKLQAKTLLEWLQRERPGEDWRRHRRTLERRARQWKAEHGPAKEVYFAQRHEPGRLGASDFTCMNSLGVTIQGEVFTHMVFHFVLTHSNWEHVSLCFSESFASLSEGLQSAFWELGGVPERHRTDRMTLAVHHEGHAEQYTARYQALMNHYGVIPEATNAYSGHENGDAEQSHRRFKEALDQALMLRGSRDFTCREEYWKFVLELVARRNRERGEKFAAEAKVLRELPKFRLEAQECQRARVGQGSTIQVKKNTYSVPARLRGEWVEARIGAEQIEVWYAGKLVQAMERLRGQSKHRIDYRHVIDGLVRKPGAFARYVYREDLYPTATYRQAYDALVEQHGARADREYLRILQWASQEGESRVEAALTKLLEQRQALSEQAVRTLMGQETPLGVASHVVVSAVDLRMYDGLLEGAPWEAGDILVSPWEANDPPSDRRKSAEQEGVMVVSCGEPRDTGMSNPERKEVVDESESQRTDGGADALPARAAFGSGADSVRGSAEAGDGAVVELCGLPTGTTAARVPATSAQPHRAAGESVEIVAGKKLGSTGPEAIADESGAAVAEPFERGLSGPPRECAGIWPAGLGEDARPECGVAGAGASGPADPVHEVRPAGAGASQGETRLGIAWLVAAIIALGGLGDRRPGLRATEPRGDGGVVHAAGGALRAGQRLGDKQPGLFAVGTDLQGPDDHGGGDRSAGAPQRDRGAECVELPGRDREAGARREPAERVVSDNRPERDQLPGGKLIVAHGEG